MSNWSTVSELPSDVLAVLQTSDKAANPTVIVATVAPDGSPHTAPFGSLRALTPRLLRFACDRRHDTFANLCRDNRLVVSLLAPPNIAVSIRGQARVVKERMDSSSEDAVVEIDVEQVKNDMLGSAEIKSGITLFYPEQLAEFLNRYLAEVEDPS